MLATAALPRLRARRISRPLPAPPAPAAAVRRAPLGWRLRNGLRLLRTGELLAPLWARLARRLGLLSGYGEVRLQVLHADGSVTDYGAAARHVITTAGVNALAAAFAGTGSVANWKYGGFGTGTTAAAIGDTALVTELTTQYASSSVRPTATQSNSTNTYTTVATLTPSSGAGTVAVTEYGRFTQSATGGGTLWDRFVFSAVNLVAANGDSLQVTETTTFPSGG